MRGFVSIVARNMKVISRSKFSFLLVILAPILIVFLVGSAFNTTQLNNMKVNTYSEEYNDLTESIILDLQGNRLEVEKAESVESCIGLVKTGETHSCISFPREMNISRINESISIYVDNSRINLAYSLLNQIESRLSLKSSELGMGIATDLLKILNEIKNSLPEQKAEMDSALYKMAQVKSVSGSQVYINEAVSKLDKAINLVNDLESEDLDTIKSDLTSVKTKLTASNNSLKSNLDNINENNQEGIESIDSALARIDILIAKLEAVKIEKAENIVLPIQTKVMPLSDAQSNWEYLFPTLVALVVLLSGVVLASSVVLTERRARANFRNFMTPTGNFSFVLAAYTTCMVILAVQMIILILGTIYLTQIELLPVLGRLSLILFLSSSVSVLLGMLVGYLFKSDETTTLASISVASLLIFFSNALIPSESMKGVFSYVTKYNPLLVTEVLIKRVVLFNEGWSSLLRGLIILASFIAILLVFALISRKMTRRKI